MKIYGKGNIWDTEALTQFVADVRRVDPHVTGNPLQAHEASAEMMGSYQQAAIYSMLVIIGRAGPRFPQPDPFADRRVAAGASACCKPSACSAF